MLVKLKAAGSIHSAEGTAAEGDSEAMIERHALLVYAGDFDSMDGPVSVTTEQLTRLVANHNSLRGRIKRLAGADVPLKSCPPIQVDHSASGWDTVGRLMGDLELRDHEMDDGQKVPGVFCSRLRILGKDAVERVKDGRWTHLSLGADFEKGSISELTVTPFPAAAEASMLAAKRLSQNQENQPMDLTKLKAFLTGHKGMSESDADMHLAKCQADAAELSKLSAEMDEHEKHLAAGVAAAAEAKLTAAREGLTKLSSGFSAMVSGARLAATQGRILTRLSRLRASAKVTPAEIKKMDLAKLAASGEAAIEAVLKTYEDREPVIMVGQLGSIKGVTAAQLAALGKGAAKTQLEAETRAHMPMLARLDANKRLSEGGSERTEGQAEKPAAGAAAGAAGAAGVPPTVADGEGLEDVAFLEREYGEITRLMTEGRGADALTRLKAFMSKCLALSGGGVDYTEANGEETEKQLSALNASVTQMAAQFEDLHKLAGSLVGG